MPGPNVEGDSDRGGSSGGASSSVVIPTSPQVNPASKEKTPKVNCIQGTWICLGLAFVLFSIMGMVLYVGFLSNLYAQEHLAVYIGGGQDLSGSPINNSSLIHLNRNPLIKGCDTPPPFPTRLTAAVGTVLDEQVRVCGGIDADGDVQRSCLSYWEHEWTEKKPLIQRRSFSAAIKLTEHGWWVTGGQNDEDGLLDTTELQASSDMAFEMRYTLPIRVSKHCLVKINASAVMLIGGHSQYSEFSKEVHTFNWDSTKSGGQRWQTNIGLHRGRNSHTCYMFNHRVYVAGGAVEGGNQFGTESVEVYDIQREEWATFKSLPGPVKGPAYFSWHGIPTLVGGSVTRNWLQYSDRHWVRQADSIPYEAFYPFVVVEKISVFCKL